MKYKLVNVKARISLIYVIGNIYIYIYNIYWSSCSGVHLYSINIMYIIIVTWTIRGKIDALV